VEETDPAKLKSVLEDAGLDSDAAAGVANRLKVVKDNVGVLKTGKWGECYTRIRDILYEEEFKK
jgi:hypothetical protein